MDGNLFNTHYLVLLLLLFLMVKFLRSTKNNKTPTSHHPELINIPDFLNKAYKHNLIYFLKIQGYLWKYCLLYKKIVLIYIICM